MRFQKYPGSYDVAPNSQIHTSLCDVVAVHGLQRNLKKVMHVQSCCFAHKITSFLTFSLRFVTRAAKSAGKADANHVQTCRE